MQAPGGTQQAVASQAAAASSHQQQMAAMQHVVDPNQLRHMQHQQSFSQ